MIGEHGLPWGNFFSWQAICAISRATVSCSLKFLSALKNPCTRPKCLDGRKLFEVYIEDEPTVDDDSDAFDNQLPCFA